MGSLYLRISIMSASHMYLFDLQNKKLTIQYVVDQRQTDRRSGPEWLLAVEQTANKAVATGVMAI